MEEISLKSQEEKIRNFERGYRATHVINIGLRFGILRVLHSHPKGMTVNELAFELMLHEQYLKVWLQTAYHFEILDCNEKGQFRLQPHLGEILGVDSSFPQTPINTNLNARKGNQMSDDAPLFDYIRTGRPIDMGKSPESSLAAAEATKSIYLVFLSVIVPRYKHLEKMLRKGMKFLDIGCGNGSLIIELAHVFDQSLFVGIDPDVYGIERAEEVISRLGLGNQVSFENMGGEELTYQDEFDMICMAATLHEILPEVRVRTMERAYEALKKGKYMLVLDFPYPGKLEDFRNSKYYYGIIEQYFEISSGIVHLRAQEQDELLRQVGFNKVERIDIGEGMFDFIMATK